MDIFFSTIRVLYQSNEDEKRLVEILFSEMKVELYDQRLNHIAALTYNSHSCERIFNLLEKTLVASDYPWYSIYKALLTIHTIVLYGSELAIDKIQQSYQLNKLITDLQSYNSALVKRSLLSLNPGTGPIDYGKPVREEAKLILSIIQNDSTIRIARLQARDGQESLVPIGNVNESNNSQVISPQFHYGQGLEKSVEAKYGLEQVPGMYEGRPDRYFDDPNDMRNTNICTGDHQYTRDALAPDLLDLDFETTSNSVYLPDLERENNLQRQLEEQRKQMEDLQQALRLQQQQQQQWQYNQQFQQQVTPMNSNYSTNMNLGMSTTSQVQMYPHQAVYPNPQLNSSPLPYNSLNANISNSSMSSNPQLHSSLNTSFPQPTMNMQTFPMQNQQQPYQYSTPQTNPVYIPSNNFYSNDQSKISVSNDQLPNYAPPPPPMKF